MCEGEYRVGEEDLHPCNGGAGDLHCLPRVRNGAGKKKRGGGGRRKHTREDEEDMRGEGGR